MNNLIPWIWAAGVVQLVIAAANWVIPGKLDYAGNLARVSVIVRQVFIVHAVYIVGLLVAFAGLCFAYAAELASGTGLGRTVSAGLAIFWGARVPVQLWYYDRESKRRHPVAHVCFSAMFIFLATVFVVAAWRGV
jgi:hypothetical protein